ncbi:Imm50 family immunity protein [Streptomyces griseoluteus]|uniref:Imm50 family immunity protein n=1 Tax=Streptomyces griseoluteus TaxID=29306 RepID=UPI003824EBF9
MTVDAYILNLDSLQGLYGRVPRIANEVRVRSLNMDWIGPTLTLRIDLPEFPDNAPEEWVRAQLDTVQCHLQFLAVEDLSVHAWEPPAAGCIGIVTLPAERRLRVSFRGAGLEGSFECSDSVLIGHPSAFRIQEDGSDEGPRMFLNRIDARRYDTLPAPWEKSYFERV